MNSLEQVIGTSMTAHQVKPMPSEQISKSAMQHIDLSKYNHYSDCRCPECGKDCPGDM